MAGAFIYPLEYGFGGSGQTILIIGDAQASQSDLNVYAQNAQLPVTPIIQPYTYDGGNPSPSTESIAEAALDIQTVAGLAPYSTIDDLDVQDLDSAEVIGALGDAVQQLNPTVISLSFGICESASLDDDNAYDQLTQQAAATGITIAAASGDQGPTCFENGQQIDGVGEPASDPYVVALGGSKSLINPPYSAYSTEFSDLRNPAVWNETSMPQGGAGGGGVSAIWAIPSYQNAPGIVSTSASSSNRNVPDISLPAATDGGYAIYFLGSWQVYGGTSWSAPAFAAMQADINQQCGANRWGLPDLYRVYYQSPNSFVDVTNGASTFPSSSLTFSAGPGYDNASGLGLPIGESIAMQDGC